MQASWVRGGHRVEADGAALDGRRLRLQRRLRPDARNADVWFREGYSLAVAIIIMDEGPVAGHRLDRPRIIRPVTKAHEDAATRRRRVDVHRLRRAAAPTAVGPDAVRRHAPLRCPDGPVLDVVKAVGVDTYDAALGPVVARAAPISQHELADGQKLRLGSGRRLARR